MREIASGRGEIDMEILGARREESASLPDARRTAGGPGARGQLLGAGHGALDRPDAGQFGNVRVHAPTGNPNGLDGNDGSAGLGALAGDSI